MNTVFQTFHSHFHEVVLHVHWKMEHLNKENHKNNKRIVLLNCCNRSVYNDYSLSLSISRMRLYLGSTSTGESPTGPGVRSR